MDREGAPDDGTVMMPVVRSVLEEVEEFCRRMRAAGATGDSSVGGSSELPARSGPGDLVLLAGHPHPVPEGEMTAPRMNLLVGHPRATRGAARAARLPVPVPVRPGWLRRWFCPHASSAW